MYKGIKSILFPTDLTRNCIPAFDFAMVLSLQFKAKIVLLHVKEKIPDYVEGRLEGLLGQDQWKEMMHAYENSIRQSLIGKRSSNKLIQMALKQLFGETDSGAEHQEMPAREIVISGGDIAQTIVEQSKKHACNLIVMGSRKGVLSKSAVGSTLKAVMKASDIPVVVVPYGHRVEEETD